MSVEKRRIRQAIYRHILPSGRVVQTRVQGHIMALDMRDASTVAMWQDGFYEPETTKHLLENVSRGQACLDIGANCGYFTLLMARAVGPQGQVVSFEPNQEISRILRWNVKKNGYENIQVRNEAVSNKSGTAQFYRHPQWHGMSSLFLRESGSVVQQVNTVRIDELSLPHVDWVKIDVEGAECIVLQGMQDTLKRSSNVHVVIEFEPDQDAFDGEALFHELRGFRARRLDNNLLFWRREE